jgi:hypothetical protein
LNLGSCQPVSARAECPTTASAGPTGWELQLGSLGGSLRLRISWAAGKSMENPSEIQNNFNISQGPNILLSILFMIPKDSTDLSANQRRHLFFMFFLDWFDGTFTGNNGSIPSNSGI